MKSLYLKVMMLACLCLSLGACNSASSEDDTLSVSSFNKEIDKEIREALLQGDYRLYASSGRRTVYPGIGNEEFEKVRKHCGHKFMKHTGDVIRTEQQIIARKQKLAFMAVFNKRMIVNCFNQIDK